MNSALNPEAPEFYPHFTSVTQEGYMSVNKSIRSSNSLPSGPSFDHFKTFTDFNIVTGHLSENVVLQSNLILCTELPAVKLKGNDPEHNIEKITDANDNVLDRVNVNIDIAGGATPNVAPQIAAVMPAPVIAKIQVGSTTFIGAKNIPRPQLSFKDTIDNSDSLWVPKISDKPNNIKPLALNILYNDNGEAIGYEHPYQVELDLYRAPAWWLEATGPGESPPALDDTPLTLVTTEADVDSLVDHLTMVRELAVDVEHHSYRTYQGITCLLQISTDEGGDFVIDALAVREHLHKLNVIFTDPKKIKVFHGADSDVVWLQRDFGLYIVGLFDTHQAARALRRPGLALRHQLMHYCKVDADKKYQLADWRIRPLPEELIRYARTDTHYLLYIARCMRGDLLEAAQGEQRLLFSVFDQSRIICNMTYNKEVVDEHSHLPLYSRSKKSFNSQQLAALRQLYRWRDAQARALDESTMYLLPNHMLLALAESLPRELQGVLACCSPMPPFIKQNLVTVHRMLLSCRELPSEPQLYSVPAGVRAALAPTTATLVHDLAHCPDYRDEPNFELDRNVIYADHAEWQPDVQVFSPTQTVLKGLVSDLNAEAKLFIPPYDRYRKYRSLAQVEELKEYKEKEAKITAISKGDALIKPEALIKMKPEPPPPASIPVPVIFNNKTEKRKRKISAENEKPELAPQRRGKPPPAVKPFPYKGVDYKKFYDDNDNKGHKVSKRKFNKHK